MQTCAKNFYWICRFSWTFSFWQLRKFFHSFLSFLFLYQITVKYSTSIKYKVFYLINFLYYFHCRNCHGSFSFSATPRQVQNQTELRKEKIICEWCRREMWKHCWYFHGNSFELRWKSFFFVHTVFHLERILSYGNMREIAHWNVQQIQSMFKCVNF